MSDHLINDHLPLARRLAMHYRGRGVEIDDLVQVANLALVKAARAYDIDRGHFRPYATATIRGDLKKHFRDHAWTIRPPRRIQELQAAIVTATDAAPSPPDVETLADELDVEVSDINEALAARGCFHAVSTDWPLPVEDENLQRVDGWVTFCRLSRDLTRDERRLLHLRFIQDLTQREIASRIGISQMQVSRRLRRLLDNMRRRAAGDVADRQAA